MLEKDIKKMNAIKWWHPITIGDYVTPGMNEETQGTFENLGLPESLKGKTVPTYQCVRCGNWMGKGNLTRWHGDNCKQRSI
jgi:hypothetical protein